MPAQDSVRGQGRPCTDVGHVVGLSVGHVPSEARADVDDGVSGLTAPTRGDRVVENQEVGERNDGGKKHSLVR